MKIRQIFQYFFVLSLFTIALTASGCRSVHIAEDVTPGNRTSEPLDWRYGAGDIRIQTTKINRILMDRWIAKTQYNVQNGKPRIIITQIDNCTDTYIPTEMIRDIIEGVAVDDGRYTILVGDSRDERELDKLMCKITQDSKYSNSSRLQPGRAIAPQFLGKIRITKATAMDRKYDYEDYRMTVTLYDIETQEVLDSAWDVLSKRIRY